MFSPYNKQKCTKDLSTLLEELTVNFVGESHYRSVQIAKRKVPKSIEFKIIIC